MKKIAVLGAVLFLGSTAFAATLDERVTALETSVLALQTDVTNLQTTATPAFVADGAAGVYTDIYYISGDCKKISDTGIGLTNDTEFKAKKEIVCGTKTYVLVNLAHSSTPVMLLKSDLLYY